MPGAEYEAARLRLAQTAFAEKLLRMSSWLLRMPADEFARTEEPIRHALTMLTGLISESFAHEIPAPDFALAVFKGLGHIAPHAHILHLKNEIFTRDPKAVETMEADPLIAHETQPTKTLAEMVRADERLKREFSSMTLPVLILHGTADQATKPSGSQHFYDKVGSHDKTLKLYDGHFHDLLNDLDKEIVMADIKNWIVGHLAGSKSPQ